MILVKIGLSSNFLERNKDVHTEHCCCKYSNWDCSVANGKKIQSYAHNINGCMWQIDENKMPFPKKGYPLTVEDCEDVPLKNKSNWSIQGFSKAGERTSLSMVK